MKKISKLKLIGKIAATPILVMYLQGCAQLNPLDSTITMAGPKQTLDAKYEDIDLIALLDPDKRSQIKRKAKPSDYTGQDYDTVISQFEQNNRSQIEGLKARRNLIQNRILAASNLRCGRFTLHLRNQTSDTNFGLGFVATVFTAAAASVPSLSDAKTLSTLGAISSGTRAEFNTEYLGNLTVSVVVKAIEQSRTEMRAEIQRLQNTNYANYDISSALADAVRYDASCSVISGMEAANEAVQRMQEPGRQAVARALLSDQVNRALSSGKSEDLKNLEDMSKVLASINSPWLNQAFKQTQSQAIFHAPSDSDDDVTQPMSALSLLQTQAIRWLTPKTGQIEVMLTKWRDTSATGKVDKTGQYKDISDWINQFNAEAQDHQSNLKLINSTITDASKGCQKLALQQESTFKELTNAWKALLADPGKTIDAQVKKGELLKHRQDMNAMVTGVFVVENFFKDEQVEWADVSDSKPDFDSIKKKWNNSVARQKTISAAADQLKTHCTSKLTKGPGS